ncbi:helix-hairpin-helix domain-containing protein [Alkalicoccus luteus]|uniref:Helix-hairpin-helix DNA-binding motif class 1 domain-containing protein n=1 Tax=Alkalicoccus luteus TaxID=1237094 RepID=A0A969PS39_9BACI|nr:helix-hairpin-helix domain-containing protein [Alkalicoccus luteus]NJP36514.1 hypothetical protein [Alkalicoccus luteus]
MIERLKELDRPILIKAAAVCAAVVAAGFLLFSDGNHEDTPIHSAAGDNDPDEAVVAEEGPVVIEIKGEVAAPGVYTLPFGSRTVDAVEMAGGQTEEADLLAVNLAAVLMDEMSIYVPAQLGEDIAEEHQREETHEEAGGTISLNLADSAMLQTLPGIGPAKAEAIIQYRDENGSFTSLDRLTEVPGIGEKTLESIAPLLTLH